MSMKIRNKSLDQLKGIAIVLVVVGHILQYLWCSDGYYQNPLFVIIYSFHMAFFMFLSGCVLSEKDFVGGGRQWLYKRLRSLIIPFFSWAIVSCVYYRENIVSGLYNRILHIENGLWFLVVLSQISVCLIVHVSLSKKIFNYIKNECVSILLSIITVNMAIFLAKIVFGNVFGLSTLNIYYTVFLIGFYWKTIQKKYKAYDKLCKICIGVFFIYILIVSNGMRNEWLFSGSVYVKLSLKIIEKITIPLMASVGIYYVHHIFAKINWVSNTLGMTILEKIGRHTLAIYAMHWYFLGLIDFSSKTLTSIVSLFSAIIIPIILEKVILKIPILTKLLLGKYHN